MTRTNNLSLIVRCALCASFPAALVACGGGGGAAGGGGSANEKTFIAEVSFQDRYITETSQILAPDRDPQSVSAEFKDDNGNWITKGGSFDANGSSVLGVAEGPYYLELGDEFVYYTTEQSLDFGRWVCGRGDIANSTSDEQVLVSSSLASPWMSGESLTSISFDSNAYAYALTAPPSGANSLQQIPLTWMGGLPDAAKGDRTYLLINGTNTAPNGHVYEVIDGSSNATSVTIDPSSQDAGPISFDVTPAPKNESSQAHVLTNDFLKVALENPLASPDDVQYFVRVFTAPRAAELGDLGRSVPVLTDYADYQAADVDLTTNYANPFPPSWTEALNLGFVVNAQFALDDQHPGGSVTLPFESTVPMSASLVDMSPTLGVVQNIQVNGQDASTPISASGGLILSWDPPSLGTPTMYEISTYQLDGDLNPGTTTTIPMPVLWTTLTSVDINPTVAPPGHTYVFVIGARQAGSQSAARPFLTTLPNSLTSTVTNQINYPM